MRCRFCKKLLLRALVGGSAVCDECQKADARRKEADAQRQLALEFECYHALRIYLANGLAPDDVHEVMGHFGKRGLRDVRAPLVRMYAASADALLADKVLTPDERERLAELKKWFGLSDSDTATIDQNMHRIHAFGMFQRGELPVLARASVPMQRGEVPRFEFSNVEFHQERVVERGYVGGSSGFTFRLARGISYWVGSTRGQSVIRMALVRIDTGALTITSKRLLFSGANKGFSIPLAEVISAEPYSDGLSVLKDSTAANNKAYVFLFGDGEYLAAAFNACWNAT